MNSNLKIQIAGLKDTGREVLKDSVEWILVWSWKVVTWMEMAHGIAENKDLSKAREDIPCLAQKGFKKRMDKTGF